MTRLRQHAKNATILRLLALQNGHLSPKIKIAKDVPKTSLETRKSCCVQKEANKKNLILEK